MRSDWEFGPWKYDIVKKWATEIDGMFTNESTRLGALFGHLYFYLIEWNNQAEMYSPNHIQADAGLTLAEIKETFKSLYRKRLVAFPHYFNSTEGNAESYDDMKRKLDTVLNLNYYKYKKMIEQMGFVYNPLENKVKHETGTDTTALSGDESLTHEITLDKLSNIEIQGPLNMGTGGTTTSLNSEAAKQTINLVFDGDPTVSTTSEGFGDTQQGKTISGSGASKTLAGSNYPRTNTYRGPYNGTNSPDSYTDSILESSTANLGDVGTHTYSTTEEGLRIYGKASIGNPNAYDFTDTKSFTDRSNVRTVDLTTTEFEGDYADVILKQRELIKSNVLIEFFKDLEKEILLSSWG